MKILIHPLGANMGGTEFTSLFLGIMQILVVFWIIRFAYKSFSLKT